MCRWERAVAHCPSGPRPSLSSVGMRSQATSMPHEMQVHPPVSVHAGYSTVICDMAWFTAARELVSGVEVVDCSFVAAGSTLRPWKVTMERRGPYGSSSSSPISSANLVANTRSSLAYARRE